MRILFGVALIAMPLLCCGFDSSGSSLSDVELSQIRGNQTYYCAFAYPTTAGCMTCVDLGPATFSYSHAGINYTGTFTLYKKCSIFQVDEKCWVSPSITTSSCNKTTNNACTGGASGYTDSTCSAAMPPGSQPPAGFICSGTFSDTTNLPQTGVNCTGVTPGVF